MSKIEIEPASAARILLGYGLILLGIVLLLYAYIQASMTINTVTFVLGKILPNPTLATFKQNTAEMPGFAETLSWFFMLLIQTLTGFFIATIGVRIAKK